jgi:hypothetical protein
MAKEAEEERERGGGKERCIYTLGEGVSQWMSQKGEDANIANLRGLRRMPTCTACAKILR